ADPSDVPNLPAGYCDYQHRVPEDWHSVRRAALKHGQGFTTMPLADGPPFLFLRRGTSFNSYSKLLARLSKDPAFKLITQAHALRLEWDGHKKKVVAAIYCDRQTMAHTRVSASSFVIVNYCTVLLMGLMGVTVMFFGIAGVALNLATEFGISRENDDRVMCPNG